MRTKPFFTRQKSKQEHALKKLHEQSMRQVGGLSEKLLEESFADAKNRGKIPPWLKGWVHHPQNSPQDRQGIDFTFDTDQGDMNVQVKSSVLRAQLFILKHQESDILVIVADMCKPVRAIYEELITAMEIKRQARLTAKTP